MNNDLTNELSTNFINYAVAVNTDRAIPDAKSGLKPVAKRILWSCFEEGHTSSKPFVKCARIYGDVMGKYHPHGDTSIYGTMVRLSQPWVMRYPLLDWHGNQGNIAGDGPAAGRYTESKLTKLTEEGMLYGIKKENVNFTLNYDDSLKEPATLPSYFPNLLCNPNAGIGVAIACNWAPHNLRDVFVAIMEYLEGKEPTLPGPDFPTGGQIINGNDIPKIMGTGRGTVKLRARYIIDKNRIIFYEVPYGTTIEALIAEVGEACEKKEITGIDDIHDESSKKIRIVITCEKGINPEFVVKQLYAKTNFQTTFSYNQVALVDKTPTELNLKQAIKIYVDHAIDCIVREAEFDLKKIRERLEIVRGLLKALEDIDNIIALIKGSDSAAAAKASLIAKYNFTENQAKAILAMRLSSLAKLEKVQLEEEKEELESKAEQLAMLLSFKGFQEDELRKRLGKLVEKYGDDRRTEITNIEEPKNKKEKVEEIPEDVIVTLTNNGDLECIPPNKFKVQKRKGVGVKTLNNTIHTSISTDTCSFLMLFTSLGKMYRIKVSDIKEKINAHQLLNLAMNENVVEMFDVGLDDMIDNICFFTKKGLIKKTKFEEYTGAKRASGIQALKFKEGDELVSVCPACDSLKQDVLIITKKGYSIRFAENSISSIGRVTSGVKAINLKDDDEIVFATLIKDDKYLILATKEGKGKRVKLDSFNTQLRGGRGTSCMKLDPEDEIAGAATYSSSCSLLIIGTPNTICISSDSIPEQSKLGSGVKLIEKSTIDTIIKVG